MDSHKLMYLVGIFCNICNYVLWGIKRAYYVNLFLVLSLTSYFSSSYSLILHTTNILSNLPTFKERLTGEQRLIECINVMRLVMYISLLMGIAAHLCFDCRLIFDRILMADFVLILTKYLFIIMP